MASSNIHSEDSPKLLGAAKVEPTWYENAVIDEALRTTGLSSLAKSVEEGKDIVIDPSRPFLSPLSSSSFIGSISNLFKLEGVDAKKASSEVIGRLSEICISILDKWNESIKKIDELKKRDETSPLRLGIEKYLNVVQQGKNSQQAPQLVTMTAIFMIGIGLMGQLAMTGTQMTAPVGLSLVSETQTVLAALVPTMAAELGLIGALFCLRGHVLGNSSNDSSRRTKERF